MTHKIEVLPSTNGESGFVRLVDHMGGDLSVVRSARVSYNSDWRGEIPPDEIQSKDEKLINYLWENRHTSPFESVTFTFEIKAPIFVFRQHHRHRTWSYNEISARYTELDEGFYIPDINMIGTQSKSNKQMRDIIDEMTDDEIKHREEEIQWVQEHFQNSTTLYHKLMERGWPRELAREVIPVAAYSRMFASVDLHNLFHFLNLRLHEHSQYEIRVYAQAMLELITPIVPIAVQAFKKSRNLQMSFQVWSKAQKYA